MKNEKILIKTETKEYIYDMLITLVNQKQTIRANALDDSKIFNTRIQEVKRKIEAELCSDKTTLHEKMYNCNELFEKLVQITNERKENSDTKENKSNEIDKDIIKFNLYLNLIN